MPFVGRQEGNPTCKYLAPAVSPKGSSLENHGDLARTGFTSVKEKPTVVMMCLKTQSTPDAIRNAWLSFENYVNSDPCN